MGPINYSIASLPNKISDWQIFKYDNLHHYTIQFSLLSKPKLIDISGECISRIYNDEASSFIRYIGLYESNQIFTLKLIPELGEFIFSPLKWDQTSKKMHFSWQVSRAQQTLHLIETSSRQLVAKIERCSNGVHKLANIQFYRILNDQLTSALIFSGCILLNQSKILKSPIKERNRLSKCNTI